MQLQETRIAIEKTFAKADKKAYIANRTGNIGAIAARQTANVKVLENFVDKKVQVRFSFLKPAPVAYNDVDFEKGESFDDIDVMPTSVGHVVEITESRKATIAKIPESQVTRQTDVTVGELLAVQVVEGTGSADTFVATKFYQKIKDNAGRLANLPIGITYDAITKNHVVSNALWNDIPRLIASINAVKRTNPIGFPFMICGEELAIMKDYALLNKGNADGSGLNAAFSTSDIIVGGAAMQALNPDTTTFYLVDPNAYGFVFGNKFKEPESITGDNMNRTAVRTPSAVFKDAFYDLITTKKEIGGEIFVLGMMKAYHEVILRPTEVGDTLTGFYRFVKE